MGRKRIGLLPVKQGASVLVYLTPLQVAKLSRQAAEQRKSSGRFAAEIIAAALQQENRNETKAA